VSDNKRNHTEKREFDRREFLGRAGQAGLALSCAGGLFPLGALGAEPATPSAAAKPASAGGKSIAIVSNPTDPVTSTPPAQWAIGVLRDSLTARGFTVRIEKSFDSVGRDFTIMAIGPLEFEMAPVLGNLPREDESFQIMLSKTEEISFIIASGRDDRGLMYALTELADCVDYAEDPLAAMTALPNVAQKPANKIRGVVRLFSSNVEDLPWLHDRTFWTRYLSMLAAQRFNRLSLMFGLAYDFTTNITDAYLHFAYPFLVAPKGYKVRAVGLPDEERDKNLDTLKWISQTAADRGIAFHLGIWTHAYQWTNSPRANYTIEGLNAENHAPYCRDAIRTLLESCPAISGVTIRTHGESGVAEGSNDFWSTVFQGVAQCGRKVEIDLHGKGIDYPRIESALAAGVPVNVSCKSWAEHAGLGYHQANIRQTEKPPANKKDSGFFSQSTGSRNFTRYGYADFAAEDRRWGFFFRLWPGTQRLLLSGDPATAAAYSRTAGFCGSLGMDWFEPLSFKGRRGSGLPGGRDAYADKSLKSEYDYEKYLYTYRLWGRLLYDPSAEPETWQRALRKQFGPGAAAVESALASSSRILPLVTTAHLPSAANNNYWPEMYLDHSISEPIRSNSYSDMPSPKRFGFVSPLDPELFSTIDEFAGELLREKPSGKYTPAQVAAWLDDLAKTAEDKLAEADKLVTDKTRPEYRRLAIDAAIAAGLGRFFADKFRAGIYFSLFERTSNRAAFDAALKSYRAAREAWAALARRAEGVYVNNITFGPDRQLHGHWSDRLATIDQNISDLEAYGSRPIAIPAGAPSAERMQQITRAVVVPSDRPLISSKSYSPMDWLRPDKPLVVKFSIEIRSEKASDCTVRLHYRHVNQAENYQVMEMTRNGDEYQATIPASYTQSPFPIQYYFEVRDGAAHAWLEPGLGKALDKQPYCCAMQHPNMLSIVGEGSTYDTFGPSIGAQQ
jgi:hypothetical protein